MASISHGSFRLRASWTRSSLPRQTRQPRRLQPFGDAEVEREREVADDGDGRCGAELAQDDVEELARTRRRRSARDLKMRVVAEIVNEPRGQSGRRRFVALHRIRDEDRIASGEFDRVAARDFRAARDPAKGRDASPRASAR